jgi:hypothetical protein
MSSTDLQVPAPADAEPVEQPVYAEGPAADSYTESFARAQLIEAQAEAVRAKAEAEIKVLEGKAAAAQRREEFAAAKAAAKAEAEIARIKAQTEREQAALAAERAERERVEDERARQEQEEAEERERLEAERLEQEAEREHKATSWRRAAMGFAVVCAIVSLPVQMDAFWSRSAPWLLAAPIVLEGGAWVVLRGADAAVAEGRPSWHYRLIAWCIAALAAGVNLSHGLLHFDPATAGATAFASLAGPGVWDLHEHGRIRVRDGRLTRRQRKELAAAAAAEAEALAVQEAAEQRQREEETAALEAVEQERRNKADRLAAERQQKYPAEWKRALLLAAALGEHEVSEDVWRRAWWDLHHAEPGVTVDVVRTRNVAQRRMNTALAENPEQGSDRRPGRPASSQVAPQMPPKPKRPRSAGPTVRGVRRPGDTAKYVPAARVAARQTALEHAEHSN